MGKFVSIGLLFFALPLKAEVQHGTQFVSVDAGLVLPRTELVLSGPAEKIGAAGPKIGLQYLYHTTNNWALGTEFNYSARGKLASSKFLTNSDSEIEGTYLSALVLARYTFFAERTFHPFVVLGVGFASNKLKIVSTPASGFVWTDTGTSETRTMVDSTQTGLASTFGFGFDIETSDTGFFGVEFRGQAIGEATYDASSSAKNLGLGGFKGLMGDLVLSARLGKKF